MELVEGSLLLLPDADPPDTKLPSGDIKLAPGEVFSAVLTQLTERLRTLCKLDDNAFNLGDDNKVVAFRCVSSP
jgi:hypothetical protein